jgi:hypothetical protein
VRRYAAVEGPADGADAEAGGAVEAGSGSEGGTLLPLPSTAPAPAPAPLDAVAPGSSTFVRTATSGMEGSGGAAASALLRRPSLASAACGAGATPLAAARGGAPSAMSWPRSSCQRTRRSASRRL